MTRAAVRLATCCRALSITAGLLLSSPVRAQAGDETAAFSFAIVGTAMDAGRGETVSLLRAIDGTASRFVVHFERSPASDTSCSDDAMDRRRAALDASAKSVVPVPAASEWAECGKAFSDPAERLERIGDVFFGSDASPGATRMPWLRQSAIPRFRRYRENVRWQSGKVLFATNNLPDNNNNYRFGAGRNGEFEERLVANRAWIERTFRVAVERRLVGVVLFIDAAPRFSLPVRTPDLRARERDGYYEWKLALRDAMTTYKGQVLLVQARYPATAVRPSLDHPLHDAAGRPIDNLTRIALADASNAADASQWMRIDVDPRDPRVFRVAGERVFDDPSGELYPR